MARVASIALTHYDSDPRVRPMADARSHRGTSKLAYAAQYAAFFAAAGAIVSTLNARRPFDVVHLNAAGLDGHPITRLLSSEAQRCVQTVRPLSFSIRLPIHTDKRLGADDSAKKVLSLIAELEGESAVFATHGDVIGPLIATLAAEGAPLEGPEEWPKGSIRVLDVSKGAVRSATYVEPV